MDDKIKKEIGKRVVGLRQENGLNQAEMAGICGFGRSNLARIENGEVLITTKTLLRLKSKFNISVDWLLTGKGFKYSIDMGAYDEEIKELLEEMGKDKRLKHHILGTLYAFMEKEKALREPGSGGREVREVREGREVGR